MAKQGNQKLFNDNLKRTGVTLAEFSRFWAVNYRTVQNWKAGTYTPDNAVILSRLKPIRCKNCDKTFITILDEDVKVCPYCRGWIGMIKD